MTLDAGEYGAKTQTLYRANPRAILKRLMDQDPKATEDELLVAFLDALGVDNASDDLRAVVAYWLTNNRRAVLAEVYVPPAAREAKAQQRQAASEAAVTTIKARVTAMVLLEMQMPNGKALGDCTKKDCEKFQGWGAQLASKLVGPRQTVRQVMSEKDVRAIYRAS